MYERGDDTVPATTVETDCCSSAVAYHVAGSLAAYGGVCGEPDT